MNKISLDYQQLHQNLHQKKTYKLSDVKDQIRKIAFDVVKFVDSDGVDKLWQIHSNNGEDYIVALYEDEEAVTKTASKENLWSVFTDRTGYLQISYRNIPLTKISLASLGVPQQDAHLISQTLPENLSNNLPLRQALLNSISPSLKESLLQQDSSLLGC